MFMAVIAISMFSISFNVVKADTLFTDSFENGKFSNWTNTTGSSIVTNPVHTGSYSAAFPLSIHDCYATQAIAPTNTLNYTYYVYFGGLCTDYICIVMAKDANNTLIHYRVQNIDGVYRWQFNVGTSQIINASTPNPQLGQWYKMQLLAITGSNSTFYFFVNDQLRATITNQTFGLMNQVRIGHDWDEGYIGGTLYFDDVIATNITSPIIIASAEEGGSITPKGAVSVDFGGNQTFNIAANAGYHIADVTVNGTSYGPVTSYKFTNVQTDYVILAMFAPDPTPAPTPTPSLTSTPTPTTQPTLNPTPIPTATPTASPTASPSPTSSYSSASTSTPTDTSHSVITSKTNPSTNAQPTETPTDSPTIEPSTTQEPIRGTFQLQWLFIIFFIFAASLSGTLVYKKKHKKPA
jgi:hypothetical protein